MAATSDDDRRPDEATTTPLPPAVGRRDVLSWLLGGGFLAWAGAVLYPVLRYLVPPAERAADSEAVLDDADLKKLAGAGFAVVRLGTERVLVFRARNGSLHAVHAKCTHEGCTVSYKHDDDIVWCACHNGRFDLAGRVIAGPPPRPLATFKVDETRVGDAVRVVVSRS